jgi:Bax protein
VVATGLVAGLCGAAYLNPPRMVTAAPKALLDLPPLEIDVAAGWTPSADELVVTHINTMDGGDLTQTVSVRARSTQHMASVKHTSAGLWQTFERLGYNLNAVGSGLADVPRLFVASLPKDLSEVRETARRKALFFSSVLPLVLQVNDEISADRARLRKLLDQIGKGAKLGPVDRLWLIVMAEHYRVKRGDIKSLVSRVDTIPPSLALAQAAEESGWGTSRFARQGNAVFGQWTFSTDGSLVPAQRDADKSHRVKAFSSLLDSVRAYARNLNTHRAYRHFRKARRNMRRRDAPLDGIKLANSLKSYSERGENYIKDLHSIIAANKLRRLDDARLSTQVTKAGSLI